MGAPLLLTFSIGGGIPPASSEMLRIDQRGLACVLVANAWPAGQPQDEVGLYELWLSPEDLGSIQDSIATHDMFSLADKYGPIQSDSGFFALRLYGEKEEKRIRWGPFVEIPAPLAALHARLREIVRETRQHPVQVVRMGLGVTGDRIRTGQLFSVVLSLQNPGSRPVRILGWEQTGASPFRVHAVPAEEIAADIPPPLGFFHSAEAISFMQSPAGEVWNGPLELAPGGMARILGEAPFSLDRPGTYRLYGFAQPHLEVTVAGEILAVTCFIPTASVTIEVEVG